MTSTRIAVLLGGTAMLTVSQIVAGGAWAQDAEAETVSNTTVLDAITVSGEKVARTLQETATSVEVITSSDQETRPEEKTVQSAIEDTPNVYYPGTVGVAPIIRGQDTQGPNTGAVAFYSGTVPRASINIDGHYQSYFESVFGSTSIWDMDQIEVFRGPQTTSQGANSVAGAIVVTTKDPVFTPEGALQIEYGSYNTHRASGMLSGPLTDQIAARVAVDYYGRDTFIDYINSSFTEDHTDLDIMSFNGRAKLLFTPDAIPGLTAKLTYSTSQNNQPTYEAATVQPFDRLENNQTSVPSFYSRTHTGVADLSYEFDNGFVLSNQAQFTDLYVDRSLETVGNGDARIDQQNWTNQTLLNFGNEDSKLSGAAGIFASYTQSDESLLLPYNGSPDFDDTKTNLGIFTEMDYRFTDAWTLTGGLRFEHDRVERSGRSTTAATVPSNFDYDESFSAILPKVALAYDVTPDFTVGALINRGFNPGGVVYDFFNGNALSFKAETSWNYEIFTRANLLDDKLEISGNLFFTDYKDAQRYFQTTLPGSVVTQYITLNAEEAHAYGLEAAVSYQVLDSLKLKANAGLMKTEITRFDALPTVEGNDFSKTPGYTLGFGVDWEVLDNLTLSANVSHFDGYYSDDTNTPAYETDPYTIANARATYQFHDNFQVFGYVNNIFDERVATYLENRRGVGSFATMTAPRMFGIGAKATF
ncbi:TonB-dependent receptor [Roseibium suaedae]|uniref:Outer membrane receptor proteins, mostly Fe transport n=1 Tax=Roseibium suaedae TaxID=735517 RepID=A0A1M7MW52_9HYPH|nr:TonB-dependent receptor [Roseibium suaedae]SHM94832.1 Outer membrane receptor proteins, mostly Fe transport [Roseibium suaedae]